MATQDKDTQKLSFTLSDFKDWCVFAFAMEILTNDDKNKCWQYLGGDTPENEDEAAKKRAMKILMKNISKDMLSLVIDKINDPRGAWKVLQTKGIGGSGVAKQNISMLITELDRLRPELPLTLTGWNSFFKDCMDLNRKLGVLDSNEKLSESSLTLKMLLKLPEKSMENIKDKFLDDASLQTPEQLDNAVQAKLKRMEQDADGNGDSRVGTMALNASNDVTPQRRGRGRNRRFRGRCYHCNDIGHRANECPNRGTEQANRRGDSRTDGSASFLIALVAAFSSMAGSVKTGLTHWVMDGAAQCGHVVTDKRAFIDGTFKPATGSQKQQIKGYGKGAPAAVVEGHGDVMLTLAGGDKLRLSGVRYAPNGSANLLAVHQVVTALLKKGATDAEYRMGARSSKIEANGRVLMTGSLRGGLFYLNLAKQQDFR